MTVKVKASIFGTTVINIKANGGKINVKVEDK